MTTNNKCQERFCKVLLLENAINSGKLQLIQKCIKVNGRKTKNDGHKSSRAICFAMYLRWQKIAYDRKAGLIF